MTKWLCLLAVIFAACLGILLLAPKSSPDPASRILTNVQVADTPEKRAQGLSGVTDLPDGHGLLFVFPDKGRYEFWMKDMLIPIDIVWLGDNHTIVGIEKSLTPETYPETFAPPVAVRYVLEVRAGTAEARQWHVGTPLFLPVEK